MNQRSNVTWAMTEQNRQISAIFAEQRSRLRNFIRRRVPDTGDAEDILQDAFYKLVEANRLLMPIGELLQIEDLLPSTDAGPEEQQKQRRMGRSDVRWWWIVHAPQQPARCGL
jgi:Sigma-70 region 2